MNKKLDFSKSRKFNLAFSSHIEAKKHQSKGWSFSNVYYLTELRDIFLVYKQYRPTSYKSFLQICTQLKIKPIQKVWTERKILEQTNALKNFGVISNETNEILVDFEFSSTFNQPLSEKDKPFFKKIFLTYFRFCEITNWFINPNDKYIKKEKPEIDESYIINKSSPLFSITSENKFNDYFFLKLENNTDLFIINSEHDKSAEAMKRFWDVFVKWGRQLNYIQKFNLDFFNCRTIEGKSISCTYFINNKVQNESLANFITTNFTKKYIYLPELVLMLAIKKRWSVEFAKKFILDEYDKNRFSFSLDRTSEIFIKQKKISEDDLIFHPFYKNSYVSNIILL